ncbi:MAG: hypothetical protein AAGC81_00725 [Pseudomonadota bacterium]
MGDMTPKSLLWAHKTLMDCLDAPAPKAKGRRSRLNPALIPGSEPDQELMVELLGTDYYRLLAPEVGREPMHPARIYPPQTSTQRAVDEAMILSDQGIIEVVEAWRCQL